MPSTLLRAQVFHTPANPFQRDDALQAVANGAVLFSEQGVIEAVGDYEELLERSGGAKVVDRRECLLVPGFVDAHVHYPQLPVVGAMGMGLLEWLEKRTLPEEARFADDGYARRAARTFLRALLGSGTTSALVFGAHFPSAMEVFFEEAERSKLRIAAGLNVSDRNLLPELHTSPDDAFEASLTLGRKWHGRGRLKYAVTPRFAFSCSEELLEACGAVASQLEGALVTSHLNETIDEQEFVAKLFPGSRSYLETYERHGLVGERAVYAHNVHPLDEELAQLSRSGAAVCHCPSSNMFLGSGLFPLRRHVEFGVPVVLGSDVGAGTGPGLLKEGLAAYQMQMLREDGYPLTAAHLLYLATAAGAAALELPEVGSFEPGKAFDAVLIGAREGSALAEVWRHSPSAQATLSAAFTLAREESIEAVFVQGEQLL